MEQAVLLYDAKCAVCRNLALKVHAHARKPIEIVALSDPEASRRLASFYPEGWDHDFYLLENGSCRKGLSAIPKLVGALGAKQFGSLLAEYATYRITKRTCGTKDHDHGTKQAGGNGEGPTRRRMLAYAAAAPLLALSKIPRLGDPFKAGPPERLPDIGINFALVWRDADGSFRTEVRPASKSAMRAAADFGGKKATNKKITGRDQQILEQSPNFGDPVGRVAAQAAGDSQFVLRREHMDVEGPGGEARFMDTFAYAADYGRYSLTLNVGNGTVGIRNRTVVAATMSGMIRHDLAMPLVDMISFAGLAGSEDAAAHFDAYAAAVNALGRFHAGAGRARVATVYESIEEGLRTAAKVYRRNVTAELKPLKSTITITSMPELMQFVDAKAELSRIRQELAASTPAVEADPEVVASGCNCECSCDCCCGCGCGCGCGLCGCMCICECCCSCGCGCGCGCCAGGAEEVAA
jgi:hypothetical protein